MYLEMLQLFGRGGRGNRWKITNLYYENYLDYILYGHTTDTKKV